MKSFVFAALASAVAVAAHADNERRLLGLEKINLGVDVKLPAGIEISAELGPKTPPPADCTNVWHPSHPNGDMDGCDNHGADGWHWVHPCEVCQPQTGSWTTSTITETCLSTVIACPPSVTNCPGSTTIQTTITIPATTTICPVEQTQPPAQTTVVAPPPSTGEELPPCPTEEQPPAGQQPPAGNQPPAGQQPPAGNQPPATTQPPVVVAPPPAGNNTMSQPPVVAGASSIKAIGGAAVFGLVAAILL